MTDVTVIGAGSAGIAAALAAARAGASTILLESSNQLGGQGTHALVHTFCGLYHNDRPEYLNPGIPVEIAEAMLSRSGQSAPERMGKVYVLHQEPAIYADLLQSLCANEPNLEVYLHSPLETISGNYLINGELHTRTIVDTTGNALVAQALGAPTQTSPKDQQQQPAQIAEVTNLKERLTPSDRLQIAALLVRAVKNEQLPQSALGTHLRNATTGNRAFLTLDGSKAISEIHTYLAAHHPAFAGSTCHPAKSQGQRESTRWRGTYTLTAADLLAARRFPDDIALASWPLETRYTTKGPKFQHLPAPAGIPLRALTSPQFPGIFTAGRCLSADPGAHASIRVIGTALATGQAAGFHAAAFAREKAPSTRNGVRYFPEI